MFIQEKVLKRVYAHLAVHQEVERAAHEQSQRFDPTPCAPGGQDTEPLRVVLACDKDTENAAHRCAVQIQTIYHLHTHTHTRTHTH